MCAAGGGFPCRHFRSIFASNSKGHSHIVLRHWSKKEKIAAAEIQWGICRKPLNWWLTCCCCFCYMFFRLLSNFLFSVMDEFKAFCFLLYVCVCVYISIHFFPFFSYGCLWARFTDDSNFLSFIQEEQQVKVCALDLLVWYLDGTHWLRVGRMRNRRPRVQERKKRRKLK